MNPEDSVHSCYNCEFTACNRQELSQHLATAHKRKVFKCHLCPFISCYKNSFDRHKKVVHKFITCEVCGCRCESEQDLLQHTRDAHADLLSNQEIPKRRARNESPAEPVHPTFDLTEQANALYLSQFGNHYGNQPENPAPSISFEEYNQDFEKYNENKEDLQPEQPCDLSMDLLPQKFKRSYPCKDCEYRTFSPRDYLYHRRHDHDDNNAIHECKLCIYATKHLQKLDRHNQLVHKLKLAGTDIVRKSKPKTPAVSVDSILEEVSTSTVNNWQEQKEEQSPVKSAKTKFPCTKCDFQTKSKFLLAQHEKTVHLRKKFFRCLKCGFVTNERSRYNKHVKYHNLPALVCTNCTFNTPYKWNLDRHMKNHELIKGKYQCNKCNFKTNSSQSFKTHTEQHHRKLDPSQEAIPDLEEPLETEDKEDETEVSNNEDEDSDIKWKIEDDVSEDDASSVSKGDRRKQDLRLFRSISPVSDHGESEKQSKKYACPLCGVSFNTLAWLARHLSQKHAQSPNVKKLVKAVQGLSPQNSKVQAVAKPTDNAKITETKLNNSATTKSSVRQPILRKGKNPPDLQEDLATSQKNKNVSNSSTGFPTHVCRVCMYKNTIMAEMERHVLSHITEQPFGCHKCKYRCRWKGDMKKHILKVHGANAVAAFERAPNPLLKYMFTETSYSEDNDEENVDSFENKDEDDRESLSEPEPDSVREFKKPRMKTDLGTKHKEQLKPVLTTKSRTITPPARSKNEGYWQNPRLNSSNKKTNQQENPLDLSTLKDDFPSKGKLDSLLQMEPVKLPRAQMKSSAVFSNEHTDLQIKSNVPLGQGVKRQLEADSFEESQKEDNLVRYLEAQQNYFYGEGENFLMSSPHKKKLKVSEDSTNRTVLTNKKYKCSYCPFMSRTASRFHVHIVQHLNKKPFMCSICSYRSNWEWDITKHIKIKSIRDNSHATAQMVITDETGRKNYEKYNKYLIEETISNPMSTATSPNMSPPQEDNLEQILSPEDLVETILVTPDLEDMERDITPNQPEPPVSGMVFRCGHCLFKHPEKKAVIGHLGIHSGSKPYKCKICGIVSSWRHVILRHVKAMHGNDMEAVEDRLQYTMKGNIILIAGDDENSEQTIGTTVFQCHLCPYTSDYNHHMQMHLRQHEPREGANIKCPKCPYWVKYRKTLSSHMRFHPTNTDNPSDCTAYASVPPTLTPEVSEYTESFDVQYNEGSEDELPKVVEFDWDNSPTYEHHDKKHRCELCPFRTDNKSHYMYHKQFHRPNKNAPFKCTHCTYWSGFKNILNKHMRTHDEYPGKKETPTSDLQSSIVDVEGKPKKMFKCRYCPMMNKRRANVVSHEAQHTKGKPMKFLCDLCSYQSNSQGVMTSHMRLHGNENISIAEVLSESLKYPPESEPAIQNVTSEKIINQIIPTSGPPKRYFTYICKRCPAVFKSKADYLTHSAFHGSALPFQCPHCDYRARHKPHLHRHIIVHTPDYMERREKSIRDTVPREKASSALSLLLTTPESIKPIVEEEHDVDDIAALDREKENLQIYFRNKGTGKNNQKKHRCKMCPIAFNHIADLLFHKALHKSNGCHKCPKCTYSTNDKELRNYHSKLHTKSIHGFGSPPVEESPDISLIRTSMVLKTSTPKTPAKVWSCSLCPGIFLKQQRYEKHITLHGANNKIKCTECDYSVHYLANLNKHKKVHQPGYKPYGIKEHHEIIVADTVSPPASTPISTEFAVPVSPVKKAVGKSPVKDAKEKHVYVCGNCPYTSTRRDNVGTHLQKHSRVGGHQVLCPYCDYATSSTSFLKDHMKWHFQPRTFMKVKAYMKYDQLEIWACNGARTLVFKDHGNDNKDRFFPEVDEENELLYRMDSYSEESGNENPDSSEIFDGVDKKSEIMYDNQNTTESLDQKNKLSFDQKIETLKIQMVNKENVRQDSLQSGKKKLEIVLTDVFSKKKFNEVKESLSEVKGTQDAEYLNCNSSTSNEPTNQTKPNTILVDHIKKDPGFAEEDNPSIVNPDHSQLRNDSRLMNFDSKNICSDEADKMNADPDENAVSSESQSSLSALEKFFSISKESSDVDNSEDIKKNSAEDELKAFLENEKTNNGTVSSDGEISFTAEEHIGETSNLDAEMTDQLNESKSSPNSNVINVNGKPNNSSNTTETTVFNSSVMTSDGAEEDMDLCKDNLDEEPKIDDKMSVDALEQDQESVMETDQHELSDTPKEKEVQLENSVENQCDREISKDVPIDKQISEPKP